MSKYTFKWENKGSGGRSWVLQGPSQPIALVYRHGGEAVNRLNKETRKMELVDVPVCWTAEHRLGQILVLGTRASEDEAKKLCETFLSATFDNLRVILQMFEKE